MSNEIKEYPVKSLTELDKVYVVRFFSETNKWVCECKSYIFHEEGFECKHIKQIKKGEQYVS